MKFAALFVTLLLAPAAATLRATAERKLDDEDSYHGGAPGDVSDYLTAEIPVFITETIPRWAGALCFSGVTTVQTPQGLVKMADLQVGEEVLASNGQYEPVIAWAHKHTTEKAEFLQFNGELEMTAAHLVFLQGKTSPVRADSVEVGDVLEGATVKKIKTVTREGVYSPLTKSGTVVVNGVKASSYVSLQDNADYVEFQGGFALISYQDFVHMALSPLRMLASFSSISYTEAGIPTYASAGIDFAFWTQQQNIFVQAALFAVFFVLAGSSMLLENTFGPTMAPFALMAAGAAWAMSGKVTVRKLKSV